MPAREESSRILSPQWFKSEGRAEASPRTYLVLLVCLVLIVLMPTVTWLPGPNWHDRQRIGQILVISLVALTVLFWAGSSRKLPPTVGHKSGYLILGLVLLGGLSAAQAKQPSWALAEVATFLGCAGFAWFIAVMRIRGGTFVDSMLLGTVVVTCAALSIQASISYAITIAARFEPVDPWSFLDGFSNLRFFGQFVSLSLPLLSAPLMFQSTSRGGRSLAMLLLVIWWAIAISSGTRGTWLGLAIAGAWLMFMGGQARRWVRVQALAAPLGLLIFWCLMDWIPRLAGLEVAHHAASRLSSTLSGREALWIQAAGMVLERPWFGFGPMHFANIVNPVAAHPHQAWLQWASEWGIPSALAVTLAVGLAAHAVFFRVKADAHVNSNGNVLRVCLSASLAASLSQAMVDGVLVMPYTEVWLAIVAGWLIALHPQQSVTTSSLVALSWLWTGSLLVSAVLLASILVRDYPHLEAREASYVRDVGGHLQPRFWRQGVIAK